MKFIFLGVTRPQPWTLQVTLTDGTYHYAIAVPFDFAGSRQELEFIVADEVRIIKARTAYLESITPQRGSFWELPVEEPTEKAEEGKHVQDTQAGA